MADRALVREEITNWYLLFLADRRVPDSTRPCWISESIHRANEGREHMTSPVRTAASLAFWRLVARLAAIGLTGLILYTMARIESFILEVLPPTINALYREHDVIVGLTWCVVVVLVIVGMAHAFDRIQATFFKGRKTD
jgi:hypothetical protein